MNHDRLNQIAQLLEIRRHREHQQKRRLQESQIAERRAQEAVRQQENAVVQAKERGKAALRDAIELASKGGSPEARFSRIAIEMVSHREEERSHQRALDVAERKQTTAQQALRRQRQDYARARKRADPLQELHNDLQQDAFREAELREEAVLEDEYREKQEAAPHVR